MSNYNQIIDGIQDQITALENAKTNYEAQIVSLQEELAKIAPRLEELQALLSTAQSMSSNSVDVNLNLNISGASIRSSSTPVSR